LGGGGRRISFKHFPLEESVVGNNIQCWKFVEKRRMLKERRKATKES
jgi:hypothetical protein